MPLVMRGIAAVRVNGEVEAPVAVATPGPVRLIHASSVNFFAPRVDVAGPNVTKAFVPPNWIALFAGFGLTMTVSVSLPLITPSLAASCRT